MEENIGLITGVVVWLDGVDIETVRGEPVERASQVFDLAIVEASVGAGGGLDYAAAQSGKSHTQGFENPQVQPLSVDLGELDDAISVRLQDIIEPSAADATLLIVIQVCAPTPIRIVCNRLGIEGQQAGDSPVGMTRYIDYGSPRNFIDRGFDHDQIVDRHLGRAGGNVGAQFGNRLDSNDGNVSARCGDGERKISLVGADIEDYFVHARSRNIRVLDVIVCGAFVRNVNATGGRFSQLQFSAVRLLWIPI